MYFFLIKLKVPADINSYCEAIISYEATIKSLDRTYSTINITTNTFIVIDLPSGKNFSVTVKSKNNEFIFSMPSTEHFVKTPSK